ncbi:MAG: dipeptidase [Candidatus Dormibacteraeota bacterium]|uniref:Dipeptidase n=1 Tax=Candidatus Amunia macphersoniae TaxID=3127014 RepID=A0A934NIQ3_9BACT|nr:dipeptidase [Candidatus Dormibacteraeota bacterium]
MAHDLDDYCTAHQPRFVEELIELLRIPSISADPAHAADVRRSAEHLAARAREAGLTGVEVVETDGHPAVYGERMVSESLPTVLVYGHHDVQPVDPLDAWVSPPFSPEVRDGRLYARGAVDDKGQVYMHLKAVEAHLRTRGELPVNVRMLIEGEEEVGSAHFESLVSTLADRLVADVAVISDTGIFARGVPSLTVGLRGLTGVEVEVRGPSLDLHSGVFGGAVQNPVEALARMLASLKDPESGRVLVPGFYDDVVEPTETERAGYASLPFSEEGFRRDAGGIPETVGEEGWTVLERRWVRPTLEINGIWGGYQGPGSKTIIPAHAGAKISCRLVPAQRPALIAEAVATALRAATPRGVVAEVTVKHGGNPVVTPADHPAVTAASRAMGAVFGKEPVIIREGGSIPPVEVFQRVLGIQSVLVGVGLPDDHIHAPNEKFDMDHYAMGVRVLARLWDEIAEEMG